jgi:hypothetical protein
VTLIYWLTWSRTGKALTDEAATLDARRRGIVDDVIATHASRMAASRTSRLKRLVFMWIAAAVVLLVSIGGTAAQPKSGEATAQPKRILVVHSYGQNFEPWVAWSREIGHELNRQSPWPLDIDEYSIDGTCAVHHHLLKKDRTVPRQTCNFLQDRLEWPLVVKDQFNLNP